MNGWPCGCNSTGATGTITLQQFAVFCLVGLISAGIDIACLQSLVVLGVPTYWAVTAGFLLGLIVNLLLHAWLTFATPLTLASTIRFGLVVGLNYLLTLLCIASSLQVLGHHLPGKLLALPLVALVGFNLGKHWVFKQPARPQAS